ncbi:MAG: AAA family ATPase [Kiritimatiellia bacterium]
MNTRYLASLVADDLKEKMVFLGGPRQVGKTTMARQIAEGVAPAVYLNWDNRDHRRGGSEGGRRSF